MKLKEERLNFSRTIVFCQRQIDCGMIYQLFEAVLGESLTDPVTAPNSLPQHRLVNVFTKSTEDIIKESVLQQFTNLSSKLRILICTAAFGMGIDCVGVTRVIHYGPPNDIETYVQQTGRSGRDGKESYCTLLVGKSQLKFCDHSMRDYCENTTVCQRECLFRGFSNFTNKGNKCNCCNICAQICKCRLCIQVSSNLSL